MLITSLTLFQLGLLDESICIEFCVLTNLVFHFCEVARQLKGRLKTEGSNTPKAEIFTLFGP